VTEGLSRPDDYPAKRPKSGRPKRLHELVNISQLRAENEIIRVVAEVGGIANISSKEFAETYAHVLSSMVEAGEPTSMPVDNQHDRRTIRKIVERLVDRGKLKTLTTTTTSLVNQSRLATLIYEPSVAQERLDQFVLALREDVPVSSISIHRKLDQPMLYTRPKARRVRSLVFSQDRVLEDGAGQDSDRRDVDLLGEEDNVIRAGFLSEAQIVAQLYGYLVGKARRARELHQFTLAHLQSPGLSSYIVSRSERIVALPFFFHDIPVSTYCALVSVTDYSPELSRLMETSDGRQTLVRDLLQDLGDYLKIGRAAARGKVLGLLRILTALRLVTPLQPSDVTTPYLSCEPNGAHPVRFDIAPTPRNNVTTGVALSYWQFNDIAPIYLYSQSNSWPPPFHRDMFVRTADESMPFWLELENAFLQDHGSVPESSMDSITGPCICSPQVIRALRKRRSWVSSYVLSWSQKQYLRQKWTDPLTSYTPLSDEDGGRSCLEHIRNITLVPLDTLYAFFVDINDVFVKETTRITGRDQRSGENHRERQATEDRALLAKKAAEARQHLEADWDALVSRVNSGPLPPASSTKLKALRTRYLQSRATLTIHQWENSVTEAISGSKQGKGNLVLSSLRSSLRRPSCMGLSRLLPVTSEHQKSVSELIQHYMDKVTPGQKAPPKKRKGMKSDGKNLVASMNLS
jgi:oxalate---CoA ligase